MCIRDRLLPTPAGTPFTFGYALLLVATSLFTEYADPALVSELLQGSSTDVVHLAQAPLLVLVASALWIAGGMTSAYAIGFLFVLTALERRIGGLWAAAVFFGGHALATLATELPVAFSVAAGRLPESSLHRLDYGISFGVMTCIGALAGLLPAWLRWPSALARPGRAELAAAAPPARPPCPARTAPGRPGPAGAAGRADLLSAPGPRAYDRTLARYVWAMA